jgi:hypothetical protein
MESSKFYDIDNNVTKQNKCCRDLSVEANIIRAATAFIILLVKQQLNGLLFLKLNVSQKKSKMKKYCISNHGVRLICFLFKGGQYRHNRSRWKSHQ